MIGFELSEVETEFPNVIEKWMAGDNSSVITDIKVLDHDA